MQKRLFILISLTTISFSVLADADENPNPLDEPGDFVGEVLENTASTAAGAVVGTGQALGDIADSAGDEKENKN